MTTTTTPSGPARSHVLTRAEITTTVVVALLAVIAVVVLWPNGSDGPEPVTPAPATGFVDDAELAPLRATAGLKPCPTPAPDAPPARGPLAGVAVPCLGAPGSVDLGAALAGRTVLLNLWASWCAPCREELPALAEYAARPDAVPVIGIDVADDPRAALRLLTELGVDLPSVTDPHGALRDALDVPPVLPVSYVVRADGSVSRVDPPTPFRSADDVAAAVSRLAG